MTEIKFSLCIPTYNRFNDFLLKYLPRYLCIPCIDEIIITDEKDSLDFEKIYNFKYQGNDPNNKISIYKNDTRLGPFLNKIKACNLAKNTWIAVIDSDNFADVNYFNCCTNYLNHLINNKKYNDEQLNQIVLLPCFAKPNFDYTFFNGFIIEKTDIKILQNLNPKIEMLMNTGNYVINKWLPNNINISNELQNIPKSSSCDVIYFNTLLYEQFNKVQMHVVENLTYHHEVHNGSVYLQNWIQYQNFNEEIYQRFRNL